MAGTSSNLLITVTPTLEKVKAAIERKKKAVSDMRIPNSRAATYLDKWVQENFKSEGGKVGGWKPFAPSTMALMAKYDPKRMPAKLLQRSGKLRASFHPFAKKDDAGIGSNLPYAKYHQEGTDKLPQRRMLPKHSEVSADLRAIYDEYIKEALEQ